MYNNSLTLVGRLGADAVLASTQSNTAYVTFSLAINTWHKDNATGAKMQKTDWVDVQCWGRVVAFASDLKKGDMIYAQGRLDLSTWTDKHNVTREKARLKADTILRLASTRSPARDGEPDDSGDENVDGAFDIDHIGHDL